MHAKVAISKRTSQCPLCYFRGLERLDELLDRDFGSTMDVQGRDNTTERASPDGLYVHVVRPENLAYEKEKEYKCFKRRVMLNSLVISVDEYKESSECSPNLQKWFAATIFCRSRSPSWKYKAMATMNTCLIVLLFVASCTRSSPLNDYDYAMLIGLDCPLEDIEVTHCLFDS